jgi:hypothetical protein
MRVEFVVNGVKASLEGLLFAICSALVLGPAHARPVCRPNGETIQALSGLVSFQKQSYIFVYLILSRGQMSRLSSRRPAAVPNCAAPIWQLD